MANSTPEPSLDDTPTEHVPVLIVGASMVGMTLSLLLAKQGIQGCVTVEKHASTAIHPRAALFHARTMQIYRELGLYDVMRKESAKHYDEHAGIVAVESLAGKFLTSWMADMNEGLEDISPTIRIFLIQQMLEPTLRPAAIDHGADLRFSTELVDFKQDETGVTALVRNIETGAAEVIRAKYMVASDGNRSGVREKLGIKMHGTGLLSRSLTIYFTMDKVKLANSKYNGVIYVNNDKVRGFFRLDLTGHDGFLVVFAAGEKGTEESRFPADNLDEKQIEELLRAAIGADVGFEITHVAKWEAKCDYAERYSSGKVLLVGDAVHTVTPHGGYGGNTGIQDTHNVAWKLSLVLQNKAHPNLVEETYNDERFPVGKETTRLVYQHFLTRTAPEMRTSPAPKDLPPDIQLELGYRYHSRAVISDKMGALTEDPATAIASPGSPAHHVFISTKEEGQISISDLFKGDFLLLLGAEADAWEASLHSVLAANPAFPQVRIRRITSAPTDKDSQRGDFYTRYGTSPVGAVLIRPDGFVAWSTSHSPTPDDDLANVFRRILCLD